MVIEELMAELAASRINAAGLEKTLRAMREERDRYADELHRLSTQVVKLRKLSEVLRAVVHVLSDEGEQQ